MQKLVHSIIGLEATTNHFSHLHLLPACNTYNKLASLQNVCFPFVSISLSLIFFFFFFFLFFLGGGGGGVTAATTLLLPRPPLHTLTVPDGWACCRAVFVWTILKFP